MKYLLCGVYPACSQLDVPSYHYLIQTYLATNWSPGRGFLGLTCVQILDSRCLACVQESCQLILLLPDESRQYIILYTATLSQLQCEFLAGILPNSTSVEGAWQLRAVVGHHMVGRFCWHRVDACATQQPPGHLKSWPPINWHQLDPHETSLPYQNSHGEG